MAGEKNILIVSGPVHAGARLCGSRVAGLVADSLPLEASVRTWGEEIYFEIPVQAELERPVEEVKAGDLAYWDRGRAFCIFLGETPISSGGRILPASAVEIIGRITGGLELMKEIRAGGEIRVAAAED